ncbi:GspH/FimT family pseudopilin [Colwellia sp. D2M02]|uniref:GspH/FimT family pseudopilin n=1 Tax=Colwellia asteriadis TaxID=517723 RepID=A0ABN1L203_9GAMM|nr:GspH/FimT family pseudopilin [Colwellia sp. D2M02]MBU2892890.1 GspH/FimT family pseudopilin [Colwellia sp. D2M02]
MTSYKKNKPLSNLAPQENTTKHKGFSLIEVMVTIAIVAILSAIALPSLNDFLVKMRTDNEVSEIQRLVLTARNTAINEGRNISLCPIAGNGCSGANDWTVNIGVVSPDGVVKQKDAIKDGDKLQFPFSSITYNASGQLDNNNVGTFSYCPKNYADYSRGVEVALSGRSYVSTDQNGDGRDETRNSNNIVCN